MTEQILSLFGRGSHMCEAKSTDNSECLGDFVGNFICKNFVYVEGIELCHG